MARLPPTVKKSFPVSISPPEVLSLFVDKGKFAQLLESNHVPHPRTIVASLGEQIDSSSDQELKGYFLKPRHSQRCMKVFGKKAFFCSTAKEFRDHLRAMEQAGCGAVIQEYIPGPADAHYFIDGFIDRSGIVRAVFARRRLRIFPPDFGNSTAMVSVDVGEASPGIADLLRLLAAVGHRGIFSGEFKRDQRDGTLKLLEVNARAWWYVEFAALCGVDVCDLAYRDALEQEVPTVVGYEVGRWYAIPSLEFRALSTQLRRGDIGPLEWCLESIRAIKGGRPGDDPMPAVFSAANLVEKAWRQWTTRTGPVRHRR
jgi:predicted ATP-grasp superfamily ATP-dependent carboligase